MSAFTSFVQENLNNCNDRRGEEQYNGVDPLHQGVASDIIENF